MARVSEGSSLPDAGRDRSDSVGSSLRNPGRESVGSSSPNAGRESVGSRDPRWSAVLFGSLSPNPPTNIGQALEGRRTRNSIWQEFGEHHSRLRLWRDSRANRRWADVFGTSPWFQPQSPGLLIFRIVITAIFVSVWSYTITESWQDGLWWIYLTHWSLTVETLYFCFATITAYKARQVLVRVPNQTQEPMTVPYTPSKRLPWYAAVTWVLNHIAMPASFLVMCLYWTAVNPFWKMNDTPTLMTCFVHGINFVLCSIDMVLGRNLFYLPHVLWFLLYSSCYTLFSLIHFWLKIGVYGGCGGKYPADECPIYNVLDWHKPLSTTILGVVILLFVVPMLQYPIWWVVRARRSRDYFAQHEAPVEPREQASA